MWLHEGLCRLSSARVLACACPADRLPRAGWNRAEVDLGCSGMPRLVGAPSGPDALRASRSEAQWVSSPAKIIGQHRLGAPIARLTAERQRGVSRAQPGGSSRLPLEAKGAGMLQALVAILQQVPLDASRRGSCRVLLTAESLDAAAGHERKVFTINAK